MDERSRKVLSNYLEEVRGLPNEQAKTTRFVALAGELFPTTPVTKQLAAGIEKLVRIDTTRGTKRGRIDLYHGNAVIEFERSLRATGDEAKRQLCEYAAGTLQEAGGDARPLICVATDGILWRTYLPRTTVASGRRPKPEDITLEPLRDFPLTEETLKEFWLWLTSFLFRPKRIQPSADQFRTDFGVTSPAFAGAMDNLRRGWDAISATAQARTACDTWRKYLMYTYGQIGEAGATIDSSRRSPASHGTSRAQREPALTADLEALFLKHTYLSSIARFLAWAALSKGAATGSLRQLARDILGGEFFRARRIENLVEDDFFHWLRDPRVEEITAPAWERILLQMGDYDLGHLDQDVLKGVYQELVDPKDRHDLGEYYTPDWLCERMVEELLPKRGFVSVLDPACGSGSFVRAAIAHFLRSNSNEPDSACLQKILDHVVGIDIHPLAVTISRVTYVLALRDILKVSRRQVQIPVFLADSLFLPHEVQQMRLGEVSGYDIRLGGDRAVSIPEKLVVDPELFDPAIAACAEVAIDHAKGRRESPSTLEAYIQKAMPGLTGRPDFPAIMEALWRFTAELSDLIAAGRDSIWAFIVRNSYRPAMLRDRFDVLIGNPPWLSYRYIADPEYQAEVKKRAVEEYKIAPRSQKLMTQMELATVFLVHTLATFGKAGARLGFVMPRGVLTADQHASLRDRSYEAPVRIDRFWDLRDVEPIFRVPSCVIFATRETVPESVTYTLPAVEWHGRLSERDAPWSEAKPRLTVQEKTARVIHLGEHTALSTEEGKESPSKRSPYAARFRQGATIVPRNFYFVRVRDLKPPPDPERLYWAETDPDQAETAKPPYKEVKLKGEVEGRFIFCTVLSKHLLPFVLLEPATVVLPVVIESSDLVVKTSRQIREAGNRAFAKWMVEAERIWTVSRGAKASKQNVYQRLDYGRELTHQLVKARHLVVYNAAGTNLCAAHVDRKELPLPFVAEHKLYWAACRSKDEAFYVSAILNADTVNAEIKPFQSRGLMGERDIEKKVLSLPIPDWDPDIPDHQRLADLGRQASDEARRAVVAATLPAALGRKRAVVRTALKELLAKIDSAVRRLL
jgi:hypothetical protein